MKKIASLYKINKNVIFQKIDKQLIGFDVDHSSLFTFNETAEYIFSKIKTKTEPSRIASLLAKKYEVDVKDAMKDVNELLKLLKKNKILV